MAYAPPTPLPFQLNALPISHLRHTPFQSSPLNLRPSSHLEVLTALPARSSLTQPVSAALTLLWTVYPHGDLISWCKQHRQMNMEPHKLMGRQGLIPHTKQCSCDTQHPLFTAPALSWAWEGVWWGWGGKMAIK